MTSILISSGRLVNPFELGNLVFTVEELIRPLAKLCRYSGQCSHFYSVAEHTVHLINKVPLHLKRAAALHDLNEGLTNDLPYPFKKALPDFEAFERDVQRHIFTQFNEPWENMEELTEWDRNICADEMLQLFDEPWVLPGATPLGVKIAGWDWRTAESRLRNSFNFLGIK